MFSFPATRYGWIWEQSWNVRELLIVINCNLKKKIKVHFLLLKN